MLWEYSNLDVYLLLLLFFCECTYFATLNEVHLFILFYSQDNYYPETGLQFLNGQAAQVT